MIEHAIFYIGSGALGFLSGYSSKSLKEVCIRLAICIGTWNVIGSLLL